MRVHQIRIDFNVTSEIKRYVFIYLIEAEHCYLIDSGVAGCQDIIGAKLKQIGRNVSDIKGIFLTHAHPDHIGAAAWFRKMSGCRVYAGAGEKRWIEDIDIQYRERPIPNFYKLAGKSVPVDQALCDGDRIKLENDLIVEVIGTPGHSADEMSFRIDDCVFIGDSVPVKGDIPIYEDWNAAIKSMGRLKEMKTVKWFYPAWDKVYSYEECKEKVAAGEMLVQMIDASVKNSILMDGETELQNVVLKVCRDLKMPWLMKNPLFARTVESHMKK
ncbi:MAG: MBL fold metallo-hydrolase [Lachnospiraceae bacterium]|nr:MBL fold metallo-hydrolase [Lachnospiraceae bacterium]